MFHVNVAIYIVTSIISSLLMFAQDEKSANPSSGGFRDLQLHPGLILLFMGSLARLLMANGQ